MIDWDRIETLFSEVGAEDFGEVVALFIEEVEDSIARLRALTDTVLLEAEMHFLKGCALNLGFARLGALCARGESDAAQGRHAEVDIAAIIDCFEASRAAFTAEARERGITGA